MGGWKAHIEQIFVSNPFCVSVYLPAYVLSTLSYSRHYNNKSRGTGRVLVNTAGWVLPLEWLLIIHYYLRATHVMGKYKIYNLTTV